MHIPLGFYKWSYAGGDFAVGLLPNNVFYCSNYPVHGSSWSVVPTTSSVTPSSTNDGQSSSLQLVIDWKRYGVYEFPISTDAVTAINPTHLHGDARVFCGQCRGPVTDPSTAWRKMEFVREFTPLEKKLMGQGCGSMWTFSWAKGCFEIEFRFDSYHHFVCNLFPEHAHWDLNESEGTGAVITIHWGRYGVYELREDPSSGHLYGHAKGQPENWRKACFKRVLGVESLQEASCQHHVHDE